MAAPSLPQDKYVFNRDNLSSVRLNYNHWLITQLSGYLLHPSIPMQTPSMRVADIGTGTGIWPIEVSRQLPAGTTLDGFDISPAQYPPPAWLPASVQLYAHDVFLPFSEEYLEKYNVVNVRFLITLLNKDNFEVLIDNLMTLLKPGGYLQWLDLNPLSARAMAIDPSVPTMAFDAMASLMRTLYSDAKYEDWIPSIVPILASKGLEVVTHEQIHVPGCYRSSWNHSHLMGYEEFWARRVASAKHREKALRESKEAVESLREEMRKGVYLESTWFCVVVRKTSIYGAVRTTLRN